VRAYLGVVYALGAFALAWVFGTAHWAVPASAHALLLVTAGLLVLGELFPIRLWSHGSYQEYTVSGAFALVLLQTQPLVYAVLPQILALLIVEIRDRKPLRVGAFNIAQNVIMFVAAGAALHLVEGGHTDVPAGRQVAGLLVAGAAYFAVNNTLTGTVIALTTQGRVVSSVATVMREEFPVTPIVLGLAPMIAASLQFSIHTAPLCLLLIVAVHTAVRISTQHEIAALHDPLTGLPNRTLLLQKLTQSLPAAGPDRQLALLMVDLDYFKEVNDTLGHAAGDELLTIVSARLTDTAGSGATVARLGGDEFAVLVERTDDRGAAALARRVTEVLGEPFSLADVTLNVTASVGIALAPDHAEDAETLSRLADLALYTAKQDRGRYAVYDPRSEEHSTENSTLMGELHHGIDRGELVVHYQPKVLAATGQLVGVEALVRWQHPTRGLLLPGRFLPGAENTPLIVPLTARVLDDALGAVRSWRDSGLDLAVSVNLTARQVANQDLPRQITDALARHGVPGAALVVEVTESCLMAHPVQTRAVLGRLRHAGVGVSIDDFGTGFSSFTHLRDLPVTEIKIDRSFVAETTTSSANAAIVKSVIDLGHNLGLQVVAEGVETDACLGALVDMGCDVVQGYLLGRPMPRERLESWYVAHTAERVPTPC
jgi:diguanylate cyclase (GGDEF)-like protein